ncbi:hypothetical protein KKC17_01530 [Patescibacteria group bacterium]|nr:hypothetical protein [Patescibacteria group bacterium]
MKLFYFKKPNSKIKIKLPGRVSFYWLLAFVLLVILWSSASQAPSFIKRFPVNDQKIVKEEIKDNFSGGPLIRLQGTYLRTGLVITKTPERLTIESPKLTGSGMDILKINVNKQMTVIEVRIPQILESEPTGDKRPETIERRVVSLEDVQVGQVVSVLASEDIADKLEFFASRIEYSKIITF